MSSMDAKCRAIRIGHCRRVAAVSFLALVAWVGAFGDMLGAHRRSTIDRPRPRAGIQPAAVRPLQHSSGNPEVYAICLKGRYYWNERSLDGYNKGLELYRQAIELNPTYAPAYAGVGLCYDLLGLGMGSLPPIDAAAEAKTAGRKALELDGNLADAHAAQMVALRRDTAFASIRSDPRFQVLGCRVGLVPKRVQR